MKRLPLLVLAAAILIFFTSLFWYSKVVLAYPEFWYKMDLRAYYNAGFDVLAGRNVYLTGYTYFDFVYTPFAALLFTLMALIPFSVGKILMPVSSIISLVLAVWFSWGMLGYTKDKKRLSLTLLTSAIVLWAQPVQETLYHGQINLLLLVLIVTGFALRKKPFWTGALVGIAAAIKLTPLIFIAYLFITRRYKATLIAICTFVLTIFYGFVILTPDSLLYWSGTFSDTSRIGSEVLSGSQSLRAAFARLLGPGETAKMFWYLGALLVGISGLSLAAYASKKGQELFGLVICGITGLIISPFSWTHHWIWLPLILPLLINYSFIKKNYTGLLAAFIFCLILLKGREVSFPGIPQINENFYVIFGLFFLVVSTLVLQIIQPTASLQNKLPQKEAVQGKHRKGHKTSSR